MTLATLILVLVTLQRLGELVLARRNTRRLLAEGGRDRAGPLPGHHRRPRGLAPGLWVFGRNARSSRPGSRCSASCRCCASG